MSRRRIGAVLVLLVAIGAVVTAVVSSGSPSKPQNAGTAAPSGATAVQRRDLVLTDTESGTLSYANSQTVYDRLSGTITWLPSVGRVIKPGGTLFKVNGKPVILMDGSTPAYRDLGSSASAGQDVLELNRNLVALGFNPDGIVVDDEWQWATTAGIDALQASLGEAETGTLPLGHVVFLPRDQLVSGVEATLGGTGASSSASNPSSTNARIVDPSPTPEFVDLTTTTPTTPTATTSTTTSPTTAPATTTHKPTHNPIAQLEREIAKLKAEIVKLTAGNGSPGSAQPRSTSPTGNSSPNGTNSSTSPSSTTPTSSSSPSSGGSASPVLRTTSTRPVVTVDLNASKQSEAKIGEKVTVELPDGKTVGGTITAVSPVAQASTSNTSTTNGSGGSGATIPVTITLAGHHTGAGLDQATVSVNFQQQEAKNVLSVPVTALLAQAGGNYAVQEANAPHTLIPVTTGLFAAGYVQISGAGLYMGLQVTDSQG
jgi:small nuclear ribonucleoprotein (snRNP)-like protein